jgi:hypothetical protein
MKVIRKVLGIEYFGEPWVSEGREAVLKGVFSVMARDATPKGAMTRIMRL